MVAADCCAAFAAPAPSAAALAHDERARTGCSAARSGELGETGRAWKERPCD